MRLKVKHEEVLILINLQMVILEVSKIEKERAQLEKNSMSRIRLVDS